MTAPHHPHPQQPHQQPIPEPSDAEQSYRQPSHRQPDAGQSDWQRSRENPYVAHPGWQPAQEAPPGGQHGWQRGHEAQYAEPSEPQASHQPPDAGQPDWQRSQENPYVAHPGWQPAAGAQHGWQPDYQAPHAVPPDGQPYTESPYPESPYPESPYTESPYTEQPEPQPSAHDQLYGRHAAPHELHPLATHRAAGGAVPGEVALPILVPVPRRRFEALAWAALALGVGAVAAQLVVGGMVAAVAAGVGAVLAVIALFGTRKTLAGIGGVLCVAAIVLTTISRATTPVAEPGGLGDLTGDDPTAMQDVVVRDCVLVEVADDAVVAESTIEITNRTDQPQSYSVTVVVHDRTNDRVAEIIAAASSITPGQSVVLSGADASEPATLQADPGPADCKVTSVDRLALGG
jgi:hypothetical protein